MPLLFSDLTLRPPNTSALQTSCEQSSLDKTISYVQETTSLLDGCGSTGQLRINFRVQISVRSGGLHMKLHRMSGFSLNCMLMASKRISPEDFPYEI